MLLIYYLLKEKKNFAPVNRVVVITKRIATYGIRASSTRDLGFATGFRWHEYVGYSVADRVNFVCAANIFYPVPTLMFCFSKPKSPPLKSLDRCQFLGSNCGMRTFKTSARSSRSILPGERRPELVVVLSKFNKSIAQLTSQLIKKTLATSHNNKSYHLIVIASRKLSPTWKK